MGTKYVGAVVLFMLLIAPAGGTHAQNVPPMPAASFSCTAPTHVDEKIICADATLRRADAVLAEFYNAVAVANPAAKGVLHTDERAWVGTRDKMCGVSRSTKIYDDTGQVTPALISCFLLNYRARIAYLAVLARPPGPGGVQTLHTGGYVIRSAPASMPPQPVEAGATATDEAGRVHLAQSELLAIATQIRRLYPASEGFNLPTHSDITCDAVIKGAFPSSMLPNAVCETGNPASYPRSPWGSAVTIYAPWADFYGGNQGMFQVDFQLYQVRPNPCAALISASLASGQDKGLVRIWTAGGPPIAPVAGSVVQECSDAGFDFSL